MNWFEKFKIKFLNCDGKTIPSDYYTNFIIRRTSHWCCCLWNFFHASTRSIRILFIYITLQSYIITFYYFTTLNLTRFVEDGVSAFGLFMAECHLTSLTDWIGRPPCSEPTPCIQLNDFNLLSFHVSCPVSRTVQYTCTCLLYLKI